MKSYTDLTQSRTLAKILPHDTADQTWERIVIAGANLDVPEEKQYRHNGNMPFQIYSGIGIPCWSLAALLDALPKRYNDDTVYIPLVGRYYEGNKFICGYFGDGLLDWTFGETPVDACVAMIEKLHEQNLL